MIIRDEPAPHVVRLRLNRPEVHNAVNWDMLRALEQLFDELQDHSGVRALVLTGTGRSFCAGADLKQLQHFSPAVAERWCLVGHRVLDKLERLPFPTIAAINGHAIGGGLELACACDLRWASGAAKFGYPEVKLGMITGWGGTFRFPRIVGEARAKELIFTGRLIHAAEAYEMGLVHRVVDPEKLEDEVLELARDIAANAPVALRLSKQMLNRAAYDTWTAASQEALALARCFTTSDQKEGVKAFLEKRPPTFQGQ